MAQNIVLGLDIGSLTVKAVLAEAAENHKLRLIGGFVRPSVGLRKGSVVEMDETVRNLEELFREIKMMSRSGVKNIYLNVSGIDSRVEVSRGIVAVARANSEIYQDDVDRVIEASRAVHLPQNRMILHTITREFIVDGVGEIKDPLGMFGSRLEVSSLIIDVFAPAVKNLMKCVESAGGGIGGLIFSPLAASQAVLTKNQKELGVILIDVGFQTTSLAVYEENNLIHTAIFPIGAGHITNDLAVALKIPVEIAEKLKVGYGCAIPKSISSKESVDLKKIDSSVSGNPSRKFIAEVIESRMREIFEMANNELKFIGRLAKLPAGAVLVGGGAKLPGAVDLAREELRLSSQIGLPRAAIFEARTDDLTEYLESPEYAVSLGLALWSCEDGKTQPKFRGNWLVKLFKSFMP